MNEDESSLRCRCVTPNDSGEDLAPQMPVVSESAAVDEEASHEGSGEHRSSDSSYGSSSRITGHKRPTIAEELYLAHPRRSKRKKYPTARYGLSEPTTEGANPPHDSTSSARQSSGLPDTDFFEILPTPEAAPIEYYEIPDSPKLLSLSVCFNFDDERSPPHITPPSASSHPFVPVRRQVDHTFYQHDAQCTRLQSQCVNTVSIPSQRNARSEPVCGQSEGNGNSSATHDPHSMINLVLNTDTEAPKSNETLMGASLPKLHMLHNCTTLFTSAAATSTPTHTTCTTTTLTPTPLSTPPIVTIHTPLLTPQDSITPLCSPITSPPSQYLAAEPELQLPFLHTASGVRIYATEVVHFRRLCDFFNNTFTSSERAHLRSVCVNTPICVYRGMPRPVLPSHYLCLDLNREVLSVKYFSRLLHRARNQL